MKKITRDQLCKKCQEVMKKADTKAKQIYRLKIKKAGRHTTGKIKVIKK